MSEWYYAGADQQQHGPVPAQEIGQRLRQGELNQNTLVWRDGMSGWAPLQQFIDEFSPVSDHINAAGNSDKKETAAAAIDNGGDIRTRPVKLPEAVETAAPAESMAAYSPYAAPSASLAMNTAVVQGGEVVYAGFWKRAAAYLLDGLVVGVISYIISMILIVVMMMLFVAGMQSPTPSAVPEAVMLISQVIMQLVGLGISAAYYGGFHSSERQATLGKMVVGIKVVRSDGSRITLSRGIGRFFAIFLSSLPLGFGFIMAGFTARKQALHDMVCDTLVVDKWAFTEHPEWQRHELGTATTVILAIWGVLLLIMILVLVLMATFIGMSVANRFG
ncbi:MAG: RDD family protein, partial [Xanthomonadaceae bacterium]|nr:RDD family protein [Xanthomonadaceae bacterium]